MYVFDNHVCLLLSCMSLTTMQVFVYHVCLWLPCMSLTTMLVFDNHVCLWLPCMSLFTMYAFNYHVCLWPPCMSLTTIYAFDYHTCLWLSYMALTTMYVFNYNVYLWLPCICMSLNVTHVCLSNMYLLPCLSLTTMYMLINTDLYGCYVDQWARTLDGGLTKSNSMTIAKCQDICRKANKKYYGLEVN